MDFHLPARIEDYRAAAPDDGNMMLLEACGTAEQKARWLAPIAQGKLRSAFVMTEPHPGGGSDPGMIMTRAERRGGFARKEISMAKIHVAKLLHDAADAALQINGARRYSKDSAIEWIYRCARQARLVEGADEVHKMVLNRFLEAEGNDFWLWPVGA